ncbi:MAG: hypothetical protein IPM79_00460 [Polyangiaceae bacterium]|nr:hypothetical protein [Polyangiaceae bacterium]
MRPAEAEAVPVSIGDSGALTVRVGRAVVQVREPEQIDAVWLARFVSQVGGVA